MRLFAGKSRDNSQCKEPVVRECSVCVSKVAAVVLVVGWRERERERH